LMGCHFARGWGPQLCAAQFGQGDMGLVGMWAPVWGGEILVEHRTRPTGGPGARWDFFREIPPPEGVGALAINFQGRGRGPKAGGGFGVGEPRGHSGAPGVWEKQGPSPGKTGHLGGPSRWGRQRRGWARGAQGPVGFLGRTSWDPGSPKTGKRGLGRGGQQGFGSSCEKR